MTARAFPVRSVDRDNEVVRRVYVKSTTDRARSQSSFHYVKVGVARGTDKVDWLGEWNQSAQALTANQRFYLTGDDELNYQLDDGDEIVVWHDSTGGPASPEGLSVEIKGTRVGAVGAPDIERRDGDFPYAARPESQLFSVGSGSADPGVEVLAAELNGSGVSDWEHVFQIPSVAVDAASASSLVHFAVVEDSDASIQTVNSTSYVDGAVSAAVVLPAGVTTLYVHVTVNCTFDGSASAAALFVAVGDGSSEYSDQQARTNGVGYHRNLSTSYATTITADTTFVPRFKYVTAACDVTQQNISVSVQGLYD